MLAVQVKASHRYHFAGSEKDQIFLANTMILEVAETKAAAKARAVAKLKAVAKARAAAKTRATVRSRRQLEPVTAVNAMTVKTRAPAKICLDDA
jgi:hypothetical protein